MKSEYNKELSSGAERILAGIVFLMISAVIGFYMIPKTIKGSAGTGIANNPRIFPAIYTICLAGASLLLFFMGLKECLKHKERLRSEPIKRELVRLFLLDSLSLIIFAGLSVIFCVLAPLLGFFFSGFLVMAAAAFYLGNRGIRWVILFPAVFMVLLWLVFVVLLSVRFPAGILM
ncbi:MAG: hypothetical protein HFG54_07730 [Lachnospiraceae bacterium]|jgi:hypothetical protein|nr:hypothetical protein [Lachnospiraceae bacterium]